MCMQTSCQQQRSTHMTSASCRSPSMQGWPGQPNLTTAGAVQSCRQGLLMQSEKQQQCEKAGAVLTQQAGWDCDAKKSDSSNEYSWCPAQDQAGQPWSKGEPVQPSRQGAARCVWTVCVVSSGLRYVIESNLTCQCQLLHGCWQMTGTRPAVGQAMTATSLLALQLGN